MAKNKQGKYQVGGSDYEVEYETEYDNWRRSERERSRNARQRDIERRNARKSEERQNSGFNDISTDDEY